MKSKTHLMAAALLLPAMLSVDAAEPQPERPQYKQEQIILQASEFAEAGEMAYLAFPDLVWIGEQQILISYKRGRTHALDPGAVLEAIRFDIERNTVVWRGVLGGEPELIYQMGEWIEFPSGLIANFVDVQQVALDRGANRHHRVGTRWTKSDDRGESFTAMETLGPINGVEYGYIFDGVISDGHVYMLAMSFPELSARKSLYDEQGKRIYGEVSVLTSADNGESWKHVRNLSREFGGIDLNESALIRHSDGFIVATRGYDSRARLHRVDGAFRLIEQRDLTSDSAVIGSHIGRPRLFSRDDGLYLLGRNSRGGPMELALFRIDPQTLDVERCVVLDPPEGIRIVDGYYAVPYFRDTEQGTLFNVITYRRPAGHAHPDIVRLEFRWDEVR